MVLLVLGVTKAALSFAIGLPLGNQAKPSFALSPAIKAKL